MPFHALIIDDDTSFRKLLEKRLQSFIPELSVTSVGTLEAARSYLKKPDRDLLELVIIDEHLPDGRGASLLSEGWFADLAVLSMSSDTSPETPGAVMKAGANFFLSKVSASEPLFKPLILGIIDRNKIQQQLLKAKVAAEKAELVQTLVSTLRHEINNPLGAVLGGAYLMKHGPSATEDQKQAADLVEQSGKRIKHVLDQLVAAVSLESVKKGDQNVFHIPGDKPWEEK